MLPVQHAVVDDARVDRRQRRARPRSAPSAARRSASSAALVRARDAIAGGASARRPASPPTPCRNSCTSSSGDVGSPASIGCVVESVSARSSRAATIGSTRDLGRGARSNMRTSASLSAIGRRVVSWKRGADARHQPPDVDDTLLHDHDRRGEPAPRTARSAAMRGERGLERLRVERGLDRPRRSPRPCRRRPGRSCPRRSPAASAIWRLVTRSPCSRRSGSVAATIIDRRSSGGSADAACRASPPGRRACRSRSPRPGTIPGVSAHSHPPRPESSGSAAEPLLAAAVAALPHAGDPGDHLVPVGQEPGRASGPRRPRRACPVAMMSPGSSVKMSEM